MSKPVVSSNIASTTRAARAGYVIAAVLILLGILNLFVNRTASIQQNDDVLTFVYSAVATAILVAIGGFLANVVLTVARRGTERAATYRRRSGIALGFAVLAAVGLVSGDLTTAVAFVIYVGALVLALVRFGIASNRLTVSI